MGQMDCINSVSVSVFFFKKLSGKYFTDHMIQSSLFVHSILMDKQWRHTLISVHIHVPFDHAVFIK